MAIIQDPDYLNQGTEIIFDTTNSTIQLLEAGNLSTDGVTIQALYSFCKEEWKTDNELIKYPFPMEAITPEQFEFKNGWTYADTTTLNLLRNGGFAVKDASGNSLEEYIGCITLGSIGATDQVYYQQEADGSSSNIVLTGAVNQCVKVYGDASNGDFDYRDYFKVFVREYQKFYSQANHTDIGVSTFTYQAYRFPLANRADSSIETVDGTVGARTITITYGATSQDIGGTNYDFDVTIDAVGTYTLQEVYEFVQYSLRQDSDIDDGAGTVNGKTADELVSFDGTKLTTKTGVFVANQLPTDTNNLVLTDNTGTERQYPFIAAGTISFNDNLVNDGSAIYKMYYSDNFGTASAELVLDNSGVAIEGTISGSSVSFDYDYDGQTVVEDKDVTVVAIGLNTAQYIKATGTLVRSTSNAVSLVSSLERNYTNN